MRASSSSVTVPLSVAGTGRPDSAVLVDELLGMTQMSVMSSVLSPACIASCPIQPAAWLGRSVAGGASTILGPTTFNFDRPVLRGVSAKPGGLREKHDPDPRANARRLARALRPSGPCILLQLPPALSLTPCPSLQPLNDPECCLLRTM